MTAGPGPSGRAGKLERAGQWLARLSLACGAAVLAAMLALTCADVVGRYIFSAPVNGKTELTRFLMAGLIAFALPVVTFRGDHITVDIFDTWFSGRIERYRNIGIDLLCALAMLTLGWWVAFRAHRLLEYGYVSDFLHIPLYPIAYFVAVMIAVTGAALALRAVLLFVAAGSNRGGAR
jgi:TRAP-type C4-dicarboxylate transport system permease small subunit